MAYNLFETRLTKYTYSGTSDPMPPDIRGYAKTYYDQTTADKNNNQSRIKIEFGSYVYNPSDSMYTTHTVTCKLERQNDAGNWVTVTTSSKNIAATETHGYHKEQTITDALVSHKSDGSGKIRVTLTFKESGEATRDFMKTYTLPQIALQTEAGSLLLGVGHTSTYEINPMSPNYTHSLKINFKGNEYYVGQDGILTNTEYIFTGTSTNVVCPTSFYSLFTTVTDESGSITLKTYNGESQIGQATTGTLKVAVVVTDCEPYITGTIADINTTTTTMTGDNRKLVPYYSVVRITPTIRASATTDTETTVTSKSVDGDTFTGSYYDTQTVKQFYTMSATNSRGISNTVDLGAYDILDYVKVSVNASSKFFRNAPTANNMYVSFSGNFWDANFGARRNALVVNWYVKERSSSTYTLGGAFAGGTDYIISNNTYNGSNVQLTCPLTGGWSYQKAYDFKIEAMDNLGSETFYYSISKGKPIYYWYEKNDANYFKVNGTLQADNLKISNNGLLNLIYPIGSIYTTTDGTFNPNTTFGGNWQQIKDVFLLAAGNTYAGGSTGGSADLQAHTHTMAADFYIRHGNTAGTDTVAAGTNTTVTTGAYSSSWGNGIYTSSYSHKPDKVAISGDTGSTGAGNQGNMPPYLTVYVWKRTA